MGIQSNGKRLAAGKLRFRSSFHGHHPSIYHLDYPAVGFFLERFKRARTGNCSRRLGLRFIVTSGISLHPRIVTRDYKWR